MNRARGFTLPETLAVVGVIGLLLAMTVPAVQRVRESANQTRCRNQLKQIGLALQAHEAAHGRLPPKTDRRVGGRNPDEVLGWMALILPYVEHEPLYRQAQAACLQDSDPTRNPPHTAFASAVPVYVCPDDGRTTPLRDRLGRVAGYTSYLGVRGAISNTRAGGVLGAAPGVGLAEVSDGTSQTIMVGERPPPESLQAGWWYPGFEFISTGLVGPNNWLRFGNYIYTRIDDECENGRHNFGPGRLDNPCDRYHFWSLHPGGGNWLFADGSVRFLAYSADPIMPALATRAGGEAVTVPD